MSNSDARKTYKFVVLEDKDTYCDAEESWLVEVDAELFEEHFDCGFGAFIDDCPEGIISSMKLGHVEVE